MSNNSDTKHTLADSAYYAEYEAIVSTVAIALDEWCSDPKPWFKRHEVANELFTIMTSASFVAEIEDHKVPYVTQFVDDVIENYRERRGDNPFEKGEHDASNI